MALSLQSLGWYQNVQSAADGVMLNADALRGKHVMDAFVTYQMGYFPELAEAA